MNPLTAHLERYQKQPPLIKEEDDTAGVKKRPFSNCVLFVLLAVFVFFLACLAVYTAVAMGIPVEKNEAAPLKSELSPSNVEVLPESKIDKTPPKESSKNVTNKIRNDSVIVSNPSRLRIQIFIKGKEAENSNEHSNPEQNKTEETIFNNIPKGRVFLRRIIIHNNGINKPEIDTSEEISSGSDESIKDVLGFQPFGIGNAPNPLDFFFNLLKLTEAPIDNFFNILEKQKNKQSNTSAIELTQKSAKNNNSEIHIEEDFGKVEKQKNEPKSNQSENNEKQSVDGKPNETGSEKQEISPVEDEQLNPINLVNDAQHIISSIEQKQHNNENMAPISPHAFRAPVIRFFRIISPDHPHVERQETYSPMYQRTVYQHPMSYPQSITRQPYSQENMVTKSPFVGENVKINDVRYKTQTTMIPTTRTTTPPVVYSTTPSGYSMPINKNTYVENFREATNHHHKATPNQMSHSSNKQEQPGMIDRIETDNIKPFEDFFKYRNL